MGRRDRGYDGRMRREIKPEMLEHARELAADPRLAAQLEHGRRHRGLGNPEQADRGVAVVLTLVTWIGIASFTYVPWVARLFSSVPAQNTGGIWPYVVAAGCFLPLAWRSKRPGPVFAAVSVFTILYTGQ